MPPLWEKEPVALLVADLHLSHRAPLTRSVHENWYEVMANYLHQLHDMSCVSRGTLATNLPIICAGDVFDRWNAPAELINFAIANMPKMYAVPGQHDLPNHRYEDVRRSAYWTLVEAGKIVDICANTTELVGNILLYGYPWGYEPIGNDHPKDLILDVAVIHKYVWRKDSGYVGAPEESRVGRLGSQLKGYDVAVFGDNHMPFNCIVGNTRVHNCGSFLCRTIAEIDHQPSVGILFADGTIERKYLDTSGDRFLESKDLLPTSINAHTLLEELQTLGDGAIDFASTLNRFLESGAFPGMIRKAVLSALEEARGQ